MKHRAFHLRPMVLAMAATAAFATLTAASSAYAQRIVAVVNGTPITSIDVAQRRAFMVLSQHKAVTERQAVDDLIDQALIFKQAAKYGISVPESAVEERYDQIAKAAHLTPAQFGQALAQRGASARTFKDAIRRQYAYQQLVAKRFEASNAVSQAAVTQEMQSGKAKDTESYRYTLQQIIFVIPKSSSQRAITQRHSEAESLRRRFTDCKSGDALARGLRDVAVKPPVLRESAALPAAISKVLEKVPVGHLSPPERVEEGYQLIAVCGRVALGENQARRQAISVEIANEKFKKEAADYIKELRQHAIIQYR